MDALARPPVGGQPRADFADGRNRLNREGAAIRTGDKANGSRGLVSVPAAHRAGLVEGEEAGEEFVVGQAAGPPLDPGPVNRADLYPYIDRRRLRLEDVSCRD